ncbi:MAG: hypothetical protein U1E70_16065 [Acetobacteraceae bacterium]
MSGMVDVTIPVDPGLANALDTPLLREAAGRVLSNLLNRRHITDLLAEAIDDLKQEARANGFTDEHVDAEVAAWRSERQG